MFSRLAGRLVTGPIGFLLAGIVDLLALLSNYLRARASGRNPW